MYRYIYIYICIYIYIYVYMSLSGGHPRVSERGKPPPLNCCLTTSPFSVFVSLCFARVRAISLSLSCIHAHTHTPER